MKVIVSDWGDPAKAAALCSKHAVGLELLDFAFSSHLDEFEELIPQIVAVVDAELIWSLHGPFQDLAPASGDVKIREVTRSRFALAAQVSHMVGAKHLVLHSGFIPKTYPPNEWHENSVRFWTELLPRLPPGLQVHIENVYEDDFRPLRDLVDAVADERFSICLDVGHVCANSTYSTAKWIVGLGERIRHVHLHNNHGKLDEHRRLTDGKITMKSTLRLLSQASPKATWIVEMGFTEAEASLGWLQAEGYLAPRPSP